MFIIRISIFPTHSPALCRLVQSKHLQCLHAIPRRLSRPGNPFLSCYAELPGPCPGTGTPLEPPQMKPRSRGCGNRPDVHSHESSQKNLGVKMHRTNDQIHASIPTNANLWFFQVVFGLVGMTRGQGIIRVVVVVLVDFTIFWTFLSLEDFLIKCKV